MDLAEKKAKIMEYAKRQSPQQLDFKIIKTDETFQNAYRMHDVASKFAVESYQIAGYLTTLLGIDLRNLGKPAIIENELPDFISENSNKLFCWDIKAKSNISSFGMVNKRAAKNYRQFALECEVLTYVNFVQVRKDPYENTFKPSLQVGHCNVLDTPIREEEAPDGNIVWKYNYQKGLAEITLDNLLNK